MFRGPGGPAVQVGAQHSQALESFYAHVPGLKVVMPSTAPTRRACSRRAIRDDNPVVFIEGETLYSVTGEVPDGDEHLIPIGEADVKRAGTDVTLIAWSKMVWTCLDAAKALAEEGIEAEVVDLRTLRPLDVDTLAASVKKTGRCVIVEVGWPVAGVGAEVAYQMQTPLHRLRSTRRSSASPARRADAVREEPRGRGPAAGQGRRRRRQARSVPGVGPWRRSSICRSSRRRWRKASSFAWPKKEGDKVSPGDLLAEVETDKANMDFTSRTRASC